MDHPKVEDIMAFLTRLRLLGIKPVQPEILYPALVETLKTQKHVSPLFYKDQPIIWNGSEYSKPVEMLLNRKHVMTFLHAVPFFDGESSALHQALKALGVPSDPQPQHWQKLFLWFGQRSETPLTSTEQKALLNAYCTLGKIPDGIADNVKCLLD